MKNKTKKNDERSLSDSFIIYKKRIRDMIRIFPGQTAALALLLVVLSFQGFFAVMLVRVITNTVNAFIENPDSVDIRSSVLIIIAFLAGIVLLQVVNWVKERRTEILSLSGRQYENLKMTTKRSRLKYEYFEDREKNNVIDMAQYTEFQYMRPLNTASELLYAAVTLVIYGVMLAQASIFFLPVPLALGTAGFLLTRFIQGKIYKISKDEHMTWRERGYMLSIMSDKRAQGDMQSNRAFFFWRDYLKSRNEKLIRLNTQNGLICAFFSTVPSLLMIAVFFPGLFFIVSRITSGILDIGFFTMYVTIILSVYYLVNSSIGVYFQSERYAAIFEAYYEVIDLEEDNYGDPPPLPDNNWAITLENLRYKYPGSDRYVLDGINLRVKKGEKIAVVGHNGCGKTTFMGILMSVLSSYDGRLEICGIDDREAVSSILRSKTSCILQDFCQYQLTVRENIEAGNRGESISDEMLTGLLKKVGLYDEVKALPEGWDTHLGQLFEGVELSKGQWQRLAIARLLADENAEIWILDEPTAYFDPLSEIGIYDLIKSLSGERLVFFISHRLGFARSSERIILIDNGTVAEEGSHEELLRRGGVYNKMFSAQQAWYDIGVSNK